MGSFREAFRRIHVAQPAISQTVVDLEDELGLRLFSSAQRIAQLTPAGEMFYAGAVRTFAQAELAKETATRFRIRTTEPPCSNRTSSINAFIR
jgi:DNA-binding transcriptional LysR family regulator